MERNRVSVSIFGREYSLVSEVDPAYIKKAADYLDSKMREVAGSYPNITEAKVAVLAALNIADELFKCREELGGMPDVGRHIAELARKLSQAL
jgi:cell division protein ZapA